MNQPDATVPDRPAAAPVLPPVPPLDPALFRTERVELEGLPAIGVLCPADPRYVCEDPDAPALVWVPGFGTDSLSWIRQLPLGALGPWYAPQHAATFPEDEMRMGKFARFVEAFIRARRLDERPGGVVLLGSSMGGAVSLATAVRGRVKLRGLVLIGTLGRGYQVGFPGRQIASLGWVLPKGLFGWLGRTFAIPLGLFGKLTKEEGRFLGGCVNVPSQAYLGNASMAVTRHDHLPAAKLLKVPTFVTHGDKDQVLPLASGQELAAAIPGAKLQVVPDSGHAFFFTHPEPVNKAIAEFLLDLPKA
ncbi:MAG: alpha/beta hydrolase [Planctomycetes bacterium]|nr:alpha/beta hydrolase [Planctomycetota bacterium]